jgi:hypothetical protein
MIIKFILPKSDLDAWETVVRFENNGIASLATDRMHLGLVRQIGEENGKIAIIADVDQPRVVK